MVIKMVNELRRKIDEFSENVNKETETIKKNQSELKNTTTEMKNTPQRINSRFDDVEDQLSKHGRHSSRKHPNERVGGGENLKNKDSLRNL